MSKGWLSVVILGGLLAILVVGVVIALAMDDGTNQYAGVEQDAARAALEQAEAGNRGIDGIDHLGTLKLRIENVTADYSSDVTCNRQFQVEKSSDSTAVYRVIWSYRTLFGIQIGTGVSHVCGFWVDGR
jgi:hypothetical protein